MIGYTTAPAHWLLDLDVGGVIYRIADQPLTVQRKAGSRALRLYGVAPAETVVYVAGLPEMSLPLVEEGNLARSIAISVEGDQDWAEIESRGYSLERSEGILRWWREGTNLEQSRIVLRGILVGVSYGERGEGLTANLTRDPLITGRMIPPAGAVASASTWPVTSSRNLASNVVGQFYPIVIGQPGYAGDGVHPDPVIPALLVEYHATASNSRLLLGLGILQAPDTTYRIANASKANASDPTYAGSAGNASDFGTMQDLQGRTVTYAALTSDVLGDLGDSYYYGLGGTDAARGAGIPNPFGPGHLRGAGDVIRWALLQSDRPADRAAMATYADDLSAYAVDTYINRQVDPWIWLESEILGWIGAVAIDGPDGIYLRPIRYDLTAESAVAHLIAGRDVERSGNLTRARDPIVNEITILYRRRADGGWGKQVTLTAQAGALTGAEPGLSADSRIYASALAARSQAIYGVRPHTIELAHVYDDTTAVLVAQRRLERSALPKRIVRYEGGIGLDVLTVGDAVTITDPGLYLDAQVAIVGDLELSTESVQIDLILGDPVGTEQ